MIAMAEIGLHQQVLEFRGWRIVDQRGYSKRGGGQLHYIAANCWSTKRCFVQYTESIVYRQANTGH